MSPFARAAWLLFLFVGISKCHNNAHRNASGKVYKTLCAVDGLSTLKMYTILLSCVSLATADTSERDVIPSGGAMLCASPELLRSLLLKIEGGCNDDELMISGSPCDIWSSAVMFYEYLTGELPFLPEADSVQAPSCVRKRLEHIWRDYRSMLYAHKNWVCFSFVNYWLA